MHRRDFLKIAGSFAASAAVGTGLNSCGSGSAQEAPAGFPQGVASGDPRASSVILWTRAEPEGDPQASVSVTLEVATDPAFDEVLIQNVYSVGPPSHHTLRVLVEDLQPDTEYFYRFLSAVGTVSQTGRTLTAPDPADERPVRFAVVNCQDRLHGFYGAYRRVMNEDLAAAPGDRIRFVLHLGDFIYETLNEPLQQPLDERNDPLPGGLRDRDGVLRAIGPFPDGGRSSDGIVFARTLEDYRHLYLAFLSDPDLRAARAYWPFVHVTDDHEFSDDNWQTEANYQDRGANSSVDEPSQPRKVAANQAWYEFTPSNLIGGDPAFDTPWHAHGFRPVDVGTSTNDGIDGANQVTNPDTVAARGSMTVYRNLRYGKLVNLVLTDNRTNRSDHAITEDISGNNPLFFASRVALPLNVVNDLDAGRTANNGNPDTFLFLGQIHLNPRRNSPPGTMLGPTQKQWWKTRMQASDARWNLWANSVPLMHLRVNTTELGEGIPDLVLSGDTWDGYNSERVELMRFLRQSGIRNVVSISGDLHAHMAGIVLENPDAPAGTSTPAAVEVVTGSVSSVSQFAATERLSRFEDPTPTESLVRQLIAIDDATSGGFITNMNNTLSNGVRSGIAAAEGATRDEILALKDPVVNTHLRYADTTAHGYSVMTVSRDRIDVELVNIASIVEDFGPAGPPVSLVTRLEIPYPAEGQDPSISDPAFEGEPPFPFSI
ncbi:MAG: alkaline phosphatase D family protein [Gammaproteobacteria bacterium]|nr:alkaline phosphatase D family protein [Gammaproteobacteria bacterium]